MKIGIIPLVGYYFSVHWSIFWPLSTESEFCRPDVWDDRISVHSILQKLETYSIFLGTTAAD